MLSKLNIKIVLGSTIIILTLCVCVFLCVHKCRCVWRCRSQVPIFDVFLKGFFILFFWQVPLTESGAHLLSRLASQQVPGILCLHLSSTGIIGECCYTWFLQGFWDSEDLNSGVHACVASILPSEQISHPQNYYSLKNIFYNH